MEQNSVFYEWRNQKPNKAETKITPASMIWIAFNIVVNVSLAISFAGIIYGSSGGGKTTVGYHILWIFCLDFLIAGICSYAYLRLGQHHQQGDGGAYVYVRAGWGKYGRFWGLFYLVSNYLVSPVTITSNILALVRQNFINGQTPLSAPWGAANNFILDMIGILLYVAFAIVILWGTKWIKRSIFFANYFRWFAITLTLGFALYLILSGDSNGYQIVKDNTHLTFSNFSHAFLTSFFFFAGVESFTSINTKVQDPEQTMPKVIMVTMIATILSYLAITVIMIGAMNDPTGFAANPNLRVFRDVGSNGVYILGVIVVLITAISTKSNTVLQISTYNTYGVIGVAAHEGYLSQKIFNRQNRYGSYPKGVLLNLVVAVSVAVLLLIIPDIIAWAKNDVTNVNGFTTTATYFDFATIISLSSVLIIINYLMVIVLAILLKWKHQITALKQADIWLWIFGCCAIVVSIVGFFYQIGESFMTQAHSIGTLVANIIQLVYFLSAFGIAIVWYYVYYLPILKKRLVKNPLEQAKLDAKFLILTKAHQQQNLVQVALQNIKKSHFRKLLVKQ